MREDEQGSALLRRLAARRRRDNIIAAVLSALAVIGGGATILGWLLPGKSTPPVDSTVSVVGRAQLVGSFAQDYVLTYLTTTQSQKERLNRFVDVGAQTNFPETRRQVADPMLVYLRRTFTDGRLEVWAATVSVRVQDNRHYYGAAITFAGGGLRALSPPTLVNAPGTGIALGLAYTAPCTADTPVAVAATGFLNAYLTGTGDLSRYIVLGSGITAITPAPYTGIGSLTLHAKENGCGGSGSTVHIQATITPRDREGDTTSLSYPLELVRAEGQQWQVKTIDVVPLLAEPLTSAGAPSNPTATTTSAPNSSAAVTIPPATHN